MSSSHSLRNARLCAITSAVLLFAVVLAGGTRSSVEKSRLSSPVTAPVSAEAAAVFAQDRNAVRQYELEALREISADMSASEEIRSEANRRRMALMEWMEQEASIEEVLSVRGYETPVVTVHEDSVNVVVRAQALSREQAGIILELVTRETGVTGGNVKIIPIN